MAKQITYQDKPWLEHYSSGVPKTIDYEKKCLPEFLDRAASRYPDRAALIFEGYKLSFSKLKDMVDRFARYLYGMGVRKGDAVAILLPNVIPCVAAYYAILKIGAIAVMNNPLYSDRELEHQFSESESKVLITLDLLANRMIDIRFKTNISHIIYTSIGDYLPFPKNLLFPIVGRIKELTKPVKQAEDVFRWKDVLSQNLPEAPDVSLSFDDTAQYQFTGGTTGVSKGVILTHGNLSKQVQQCEAWFPTFQNTYQIMLGALPFFHVFGLTVAMNFAIHQGWTNILVAKPRPEQLLSTIHKQKPTFAPLVPTMYIGMLNHENLKKTDMTSLLGCFSGSAPLAVEVINKFEKITGSEIVEGYGLTETSPVTHVNPFGGQRKVGSIGLPISDTLCRIVDLDDGVTQVEVGEPGELSIKGPQVMTGYRKMPEETEKVLNDGWLLTGDIAKMDEEGYFYIVDRKKDMIISGGYNVYPRDIDEVLYEHPKVQEACAIGIPHDTRGEAVKVFIVLREGEEATKDEIIDYCKDKLAKYKLPAEVEFRDELPKTNVGKILRKELRQEEMEKRGEE